MLDFTIIDVVDFVLYWVVFTVKKDNSFIENPKDVTFLKEIKKLVDVFKVFKVGANFEV